MVRGLLRVGGLAAAVLIALSFGLQKSGVLDLVSFSRPQPEIDESFQRGFRSDAMSKINRVRGPLRVGPVRGDEDVQALLLELVAAHPDPEGLPLDDVFNALQERFPGAQYLAANLVVSRDRDDLLENLSSWTAAANPDFDTINTAVFPAGRRMGALGVMSRRIPEFSLSGANGGGGKFHNRCPHCDKVHALEIERESRTLILSCPYCDLPFDVLALDTKGSMRRASDFFEGFHLDEGDSIAAESSPERRIVAIWSRIAERCDYELDQDGSSAHEVWKTPGETWREKAGDCEDTSILLADALLSAGFEARVAIGWNGNIGQHAWVVVRAGEAQYVLESTIQVEITEESLTPLETAAAYYQPEQLFDRENLYFTTASPDEFRSDYFSAAFWRSIPRGSGSRSPRLSMR